MPPANITDKNHPMVRYVIFIVLKEIAQAIIKENFTNFHTLNNKQAKALNKEADKLAMIWFNEFAKNHTDSNIKAITIDEIRIAEEKSQRMSELISSGTLIKLIEEYQD